MVNEVKLDKIESTLMTSRPINPKNNTEASSDHQQEVVITNHLNDWVKLINSYEEPVSSAAVESIKNKIQQNQYTIDFDKLAEKMLTSDILVMAGD